MNNDELMAKKVLFDLRSKCIIDELRRELKQPDNAELNQSVKDAIYGAVVTGYLMGIKENYNPSPYEAMDTCRKLNPFIDHIFPLDD